MICLNLTESDREIDVRLFFAMAVGLALAGPVQGSESQQTQEQQFEGAYAQVKECLPVRVEWKARSGDSVWAELEATEGDSIVMRTPIGTTSSPDEGSDSRKIMVLVDEQGNGVISKTGEEGGPLRSGSQVSQNPMLQMMLRTAVNYAVRTGQACD